MSDDRALPSPWLSAKAAGQYLNGRSAKFVVREIKAGRLRGAVISGRGRGEVVTRSEWCDEYILERVTPTTFPVRRRLG